jgi:hypothetical protein
MPIAALTAVLLAAGPVYARWHETGRDSERVDAVDLASIEGDGQVRRAWSRVDYARARDGGVMTVLYQNEYDCARRTYSLLAWRRLGADGREADAGTVPAGDRRTDAIQPDTIGADEIALVCGETSPGPPPIVA